MLRGAWWGLLGSVLVTAAAWQAQAQQGIALDQYQPPLAGDTFLAVPSPWIGGHLVPRGAVTFEYAQDPLVLVDANDEDVATLVSSQAFLHLGASFALFDRVMAALDFPLAVVQSGDDAIIAGALASPDGAAAGDLRIGLRGRLWGEYYDPFQIGVGGYLWVPTGPEAGYSGEGAVYGQPEVLLGGRLPFFVWSVAGGTILRASDNPHTFVYKAGVGLEVLDHRLHLGPEVFGAVDLTEEPLFGAIERKSAVNAEWLFGAKFHVFQGLAVGAAGGTGLSDAVGTPAFRVLGRVEWNPLPEKEKPARPGDRDRDGIADREDACPDLPGVPHQDPRKHGCPSDRDGDRIIDAQDACPDVPGLPDRDPSKHGCPPPGDRDGDGILDDVDACPETPGIASSDPRKHGCPDRDGDGIIDPADACPDAPGVPHEDPKKNGCPPDTDGDGILDAVDACPTTPGPADPDPARNGCPRALVTDTEIKIFQKIEFEFDKANILPVSAPILDEVARLMKENPDIARVEVQGHTDSKGAAFYNKALSQRRAEAVTKALSERGVEAARLSAKGYGAEKPIASNDTDEGRAQNRRVEFQILERAQKAPPAPAP